MKYALALKYTSLEGVEHVIDVLPSETALQRAHSLKVMQENADFVGFLSDETISKIEALLGETADEGHIDIEIGESNYPLFIIATSLGTPNESVNDASALRISETDAEINTDAFNEATMCDGGPNRKETLRHAREAFRQIGSINESIATLPTILESLQSRLTALETAAVPQAAVTTVETPATETVASTTPVDVPATETAAATADVPSEETDTAIADVQVESPLVEEGNTPASQTATQEEPATTAVTETKPEGELSPVLDAAARSSLRRLSAGRKNAGIIL